MRGLPEIPIRSFGATVSAQLGVGNALRQKLLLERRSVPDPVHVQLLIDTGASCSWIRPAYIAQLGLTEPISWIDVVKTEGIVDRLPCYEVCLILGGANTPTVKRIDTAIGVDDFKDEPTDGLLGRDILQFLQFAWNGPSQKVTVQYT